MINSVGSLAKVNGTLTMSSQEMDNAAIALPSKIYYRQMQAFSSDHLVKETGSIKNYSVKTSASQSNNLAYSIFMVWFSPFVAIACFSIESFIDTVLGRKASTQMSLSLENQPIAEIEADLHWQIHPNKRRLCIPVEIQIERESNKEVRVLRTVFEQHVRKNWFGDAPYRANWTSRAPSVKEAQKHPPQLIAKVSEEAWRVFQKGIERRSNLASTLPMQIEVLPSDAIYYKKTRFQKIFG